MWLALLSSPRTWILLIIGVLAIGMSVQSLRLDSAQKALVAIKGEYAIRDRAAEEAYSARYAAAVERVRAAEDKSAKSVAEVSSKLTKEIGNVAKQRDVALANIESGKLAFRVQLDTERAGSAGRGADGQAGAGAGGGNATKGSDVSKPTVATLRADDSAFLVGLASECDIVAKQLTAAQAIIVKDREVCK